MLVCLRNIFKTAVINTIRRGHELTDLQLLCKWVKDTFGTEWLEYLEMLIKGAVQSSSPYTLSMRKHNLFLSKIVPKFIIYKYYD